MPALQNGQSFPHLEFPRVGGGRLALPEDLSGNYSVVLFYRGSWCPYCNAQLAAFQRAAGSLAEAGIQVVAVSVDDEAAATGLVDKHHLSFPVAHSADASVVSAATGAFVNPDPVFLQSTGFVLAADGTIVTAVYSSGAIGRLLPQDVIGLVQYLQASAA